MQSGDTCFHLWSSNDLTEQQFATLNPTVYPTCGAKLQAGVSVCLGNRKKYLRANRRHDICGNCNSNTILNKLFLCVPKSGSPKRRCFDKPCAFRRASDIGYMRIHIRSTARRLLLPHLDKCWPDTGCFFGVKPKHQLHKLTCELGCVHIFTRYDIIGLCVFLILPMALCLPHTCAQLFGRQKQTGKHALTDRGFLTIYVTVPACFMTSEKKHEQKCPSSIV